MTDLLIPLAATVTPWMLAVIGAILAAGIVLVFLGLRRQKSGAGTEVPVEGARRADFATPENAVDAEAGGDTVVHDPRA